MYYRESYERRCPHCEEWNPATVQTCFHCDRNLEGEPIPYLEEQPSIETSPPPPDHFQQKLVWAAGLVALLFVASLTMYFCR